MNMKLPMNNFFCVPFIIQAMKRGLFFSMMLFISLSVYSQQADYLKANKILEERGEVYFSFLADDDVVNQNIEHLSSLLSIDRASDSIIWAYANQTSFDHFITLDID